MWQWFKAALLHDIGKTVLNSTGWWSRHEALDKPLSAADYPTLVGQGGVDFVKLLGRPMVDQIAGHHRGPSPERSTVENALVMADRLQKAMYQSMTKDGGILEDAIKSVCPNARLTPPFYPYYGKPLAWTEAGSANLVLSLVSRMSAWQQRPTLRQILDLQKELLHYPHTTPNIPHNSLAFHHRFTALCFYFLHNALVELEKENKSIYDWDGLTFYLIAIKPDPLSLLYRLKDARAQRLTMDALRQRLFQKVFLLQDKIYLPEIDVSANPFEFFGGDSLVLVYDDDKAITNALQEIMEEDETGALWTLNIERVQYTIPAPAQWKSGSVGFRTLPKDVHTDPRRSFAILAPQAQTFTSTSAARCQRCTRPLELAEEETEGLCDACVALIEQVIGEGKGVDLGQVALSKEGQQQRLGYVFLNVRSPLREHAQDVAGHLLDEMKAQAGNRWKIARKRTKEDRDEIWSYIRPTSTGLFEYLQAVMEMEKFQEDVMDGQEGVFRLLEFPEQMIWVTREDRYWDFLDHVNSLRRKVHLETSLSGVLCHPRTPFWSLMDRLARFSKQEGIYQQGIYYDLSGGEIMIFIDDEVQAIRNLARAAVTQKEYKTQLNALVRLARKASLEELILEIDTRANQGKLRGKFPSELGTKLRALVLSGDVQKDRDKRALFIKNVVRLAGFRERGRQTL